MVPRRAPGGPKSHIVEFFVFKWRFCSELGFVEFRWFGIVFSRAQTFRKSRDAAPVHGPRSWENKREGPIRSNDRLACDEIIYLSLL